MSYHWFEFAPGHGMYDEVVNKLNQPAITPSWADPMVNWGINRPDFSSALNYGAMTQPDAIKQTWNFNVANQQQQQQQGQGQQGQRQQGQGQQGQRQQGQGQADRWGQDQGQGQQPGATSLYEDLRGSNQTLSDNAWTEAYSGVPALIDYDPRDQYRVLMGSGLPNYNIPGYRSIYESQFDPTFGQYLLGGYGDQGGTGMGTETAFADWFRNRPVGTDLSAGWNIARQLSNLMPRGFEFPSEEYEMLKGANLNMAELMTDPNAVQAMAQARYFQGRDPRTLGGYPTRVFQSAMNTLFSDWQRRNMASNQPQLPGAFLSTLTGNRWA